jgi:hypothetical protein
MKSLASLIFAAALLATPALAADNLPSNPVFKALAAPTSCVAAGNCSGAYWDFALENNANLGGALTGGNGGQIGIDTGFGYQLWKGSWLAGIEVNAGYQPGTGGATGTFTSTQFVKLGYNFFTSTQTGTAAAPTAAPAASQNPFVNLVPANIPAKSTPAIIAGGCLAHGIEKGCAGFEVDSVIAAGWTTAFQYYNAPSVKGQADENVFRIMVQKHF